MSAAAPAGQSLLNLRGGGSGGARRQAAANKVRDGGLFCRTQTKVAAGSDSNNLFLAESLIGVEIRQRRCQAMQGNESGIVTPSVGTARGWVGECGSAQHAPEAEPFERCDRRERRRESRGAGVLNLVPSAQWGRKS